MRERIYSYYFVDVYYVAELIPGFHPLAPLPDIRVLQSENQATPHRVLQSENQAPLLRTCRFLRKDAWPSYVRHIFFVIASPIPPLRRIKFPEWKDYTENLYRSMKVQAELAELHERAKQAGSVELVRFVEDQAPELLDHDVGKEDEVPPKKISAFDWERQENYYQNWHIPVLLLSEIIPNQFLRHIRSITGLHLEDLSDQYLLHNPDIYQWLAHDKLPCLELIGFEQRTIEWEQDIGSNDYDHVVAKLLTPKSDAYKADELCWDRARVHWNTHPTIHFVTKFYAQHFREHMREKLLTVCAPVFPFLMSCD